MSVFQNAASSYSEIALPLTTVKGLRGTLCVLVRDFGRRLGRTMRTLLLVACSLIASLAGTAAAQTPAYPSKTVKLVVPTPPGSPPDGLARVVIHHLQARLGGTIIIDNRPGAGHTIASKAVARAEPDGYTLL